MYGISHQCSSNSIYVFSICINTLSHVTLDYKSVMRWKLNDIRQQTSNTPFVHTYDSDQLRYQPINLTRTIVFDSLHTQDLKRLHDDSKGFDPICWRLKLIWVFTGRGSTHHIVGFLMVSLLVFMSVYRIVHMIRNRAVRIVEYVK